MPEVWIRMIKQWIDDYNAIRLLYKQNIVDEDELIKLQDRLLGDIIITFKSEVEENE